MKPPRKVADNSVQEAPLDRKIADLVMREIIEWRIRPGTWIREREIAERFGCSHAPVREAFRHLSHEGFVEVVPWRGARVLELDKIAVMDVFTVWKALFAAVCSIAAARFDQINESELLSLFHAYAASVSKLAPIREQIKLAWRVGNFITANSGSPLAADLLIHVARIALWQHRFFDRVSQADLIADTGPAEAVRLYRIVVDSIIARDAEDAEIAARAYLSHSQAHMSRLLGQIELGL